MSVLYTSLASNFIDDDYIEVVDEGTPPHYVHPETLTHSANSFRVVAVTSATKHAGTTTAVTTLAATLNHASNGVIKVAVLDLNTHHPDLYNTTDTLEFDFVSLSDSEQYDSDYIKKHKLATEQGFDCFILFGDTLPRVDHERNKLNELLTSLSENYDVVLIDTEDFSAHNPYTLLSLQESDMVLCVSNPDSQSISIVTNQIEEFVQPLSAGGLGLNSDTTGVILNRNSLDLLTVHRMTDELRKSISLVGTIPVLCPNSSNVKKNLQALQEQPHLSLPVLVALKNIFTDYSFTE